MVNKFKALVVKLVIMVTFFSNKGNWTLTPMMVNNSEVLKSFLQFKQTSRNN